MAKIYASKRDRSNSSIRKIKHPIHAERKNRTLEFALAYATSEAIAAINDDNSIDPEAIKLLIEKNIPGEYAVIMSMRFGEGEVEDYETMANNFHTLVNRGYRGTEAAFIAAECQRKSGGKYLDRSRRRNDKVYLGITHALANLLE